MKTRKRAFTLIELLVVISIIALLMAILMPALGRAKKQAQYVTCRARLRNVIYAVMQYAEDNNQELQGNPDSWFKVLMPYYGYKGDPNRGNSFIKFLKDSDAFVCDTAISRYKVKNDLYYRTFAINRNIVWNPAQPEGQKNPIMKYSDPKRPGDTLYCADVGYYFGDKNPSDGRYFGCIDDNMWYTPRFFHFGNKLVNLGQGSRSNVFIDGRENILFFDGHVDGVKFTEFPFNPYSVSPEVMDEWDASGRDHEMFWFGM
jgi:prepilin-type N-terminal cleavage/methylation domain-containing protein/prepilin-type processing-associated H-X9-DG protein